MNIDISGLNKADVLAALYNASRPVESGFLQAAGRPFDLNRTLAQELLDQAAAEDPQLLFDYVYGRPLRIDLTDDVEIDPQWYDEANGGDGTAARIIQHLRTTGMVTRADGSSFETDLLTEHEATLLLMGGLERAKK